MPAEAGNVAAIRDDVYSGTSTAPDSGHAVRLAKLIHDVLLSAQIGDTEESRRLARIGRGESVGQIIRLHRVGSSGSSQLADSPRKPFAPAKCDDTISVNRMLGAHSSVHQL
jgi:hypothetical protein